MSISLVLQANEQILLFSSENPIKFNFQACEQEIIFWKYKSSDSELSFEIISFKINLNIKYLSILVSHIAE